MRVFTDIGGAPTDLAPRIPKAEGHPVVVARFHRGYPRRRAGHPQRRRGLAPHRSAGPPRHPLG